MIHGSSNHPVYVKKIYLKTWLLRDEIIEVIKKRLTAGQKLENINIDKIKAEYSFKGPLPIDPEGLPNKIGKQTDDEKANALKIVENESDEEVESNDDINDDTEEQENNSEEVLQAEASVVEETSQPTSSENDFLEIDLLAPVERNNVIILNQRHPKLADDKMYKGTTLLTEITINQMYFFSNKSFLEGQSIVIEFLIPKRFVINAEVKYCRSFNHKSRIISPSRLAYRVAVKFTFLKPGERTLIRQFLKSVEPQIPEPMKTVTKKAEKDSEDDDDLGDLDGLDL